MATCLFKDANHLCGEPAVTTVAVGPDAAHTMDVPACERHLVLMQSVAEAAHLSASATPAEAPAEPPATPAA